MNLADELMGVYKLPRSRGRKVLLTGVIDMAEADRKAAHERELARQRIKNRLYRAKVRADPERAAKRTAYTREWAHRNNERRKEYRKKWLSTRMDWWRKYQREWHREKRARRAKA